MSNWTDTTKTATASFINGTKNAETWSGSNKIGSAWEYEEADLTYEMAVLAYNYYGGVPSYTNLTKN
jgi:hypothetical protein